MDDTLNQARGAWDRGRHLPQPGPVEADSLKRVDSAIVYYLEELGLSAEIHTSKLEAVWLTNGALFEATLQYVSEGRYGVLSTVPVNAAWRVLLLTFWPRVDCTLNHVTASWVIAPGVPVKLWPSCAPTHAVTLDSNTIFPRQHPFFHCF